MHKGRYSPLALALIAVLAVGLTFAAGGTNVSAQTTQPTQQVAPHHRLFGSITSISAEALVVTGRDGKPVTVRIASGTRIFERAAAQLSDIKAGDTVRIVAQKAQDGSFTALAVLDAPANLPSDEEGRGGTRELRSGRVLIRGSVASVSGTSLSVAAANGSATTIAVPSAARIQRLTALTATSLSAGMRVAVRGTSNPDGSVTASVIMVAPATKQ